MTPTPREFTTVLHYVIYIPVVSEALDVTTREVRLQHVHLQLQICVFRVLQTCTLHAATDLLFAASKTRSSFAVTKKKKKKNQLDVYGCLAVEEEERNETIHAEQH